MLPTSSIPSQRIKSLGLLLLLLGVLGSVSSLPLLAADPPAPQYFLVELHGKRPGWPGDMTEAEGAIMSEHFAYLKALTAKGTVLCAGPVNEQWGLIILKVASEAEARAIMDSEPSVAKGLHTYKLAPMTVSLLADYIRPSRYPAQISDREVIKEVTVKASLADVWRAWTTDAGAREFFSPATKIELRPGGPYEIYFNQGAPPGEQGGEGNRVLSFLPQRLLSFEWNAPPTFGPLRDIRTRVVIFFEPVGADSVRVEFHHSGWGIGEDWQKVYDYFENAWSHVLANFERRFQEGPLKFE